MSVVMVRVFWGYFALINMGIITRTLRIVPVALCFFLPNGNNTVVAEMVEISFHFKKKFLLNNISHPTKCKTFEIYFQAESRKCSLSNLSFLETQTSGLSKTRVPSRDTYLISRMLLRPLTYLVSSSFTAAPAGLNWTGNYTRWERKATQVSWADSAGH